MVRRTQNCDWPSRRDDRRRRVAAAEGSFGAVSEAQLDWPALRRRRKGRRLADRFERGLVEIARSALVKDAALYKIAFSVEIGRAHV